MSRMGRKGLLGLSLLGASSVTVVLGFAFRPTPVLIPVPPAQSQENASKPKPEEALRDASILDLIRNARVATRKGDEVTRTAMVTALRKEPTRARNLIHREISKTTDSTDLSILNRIALELP
jgi:hypothetical protein